MHDEMLSLIPAVGVRVSKGITAFRKIYVPGALHTACAAVFEEIRMTAMMREEGEPAEGLFLTELSGSGKTTVAKRYIAKVDALYGAAKNKGPARIITVSEQGTSSSFWSSILEFLGDPYYATGSEQNLKKRVKKAIRREGIQLLFIDELNHTVEKSQANQILNAIKNMISEGLVSIVAMGSSEELDKLSRNDAFQGRMVECPGLPPYTWKHDAQEWIELCKGLDERMVAEKIVRAPSDLGTEVLARALLLICEGLIGRLNWLVRTALRSTLRRDDDSISLGDLIAAGNALLLKFPREGAVNPLGSLR